MKWQIGDKSAMETLIHVAEYDDKNGVRIAADEAIKKIKSK